MAMKIRKRWLLALFLVCLSVPLFYADEDVEDAVTTEDAEGGAEEVTMKIDGLSDEATAELRAQMDANKEAWGTQTDRMMKLIIHSLYKNKDIFLRELISNASDALDKIRLLSLTDKEALDSTDELSIKIMADADNSVLHITDTGIGMTKEQLSKFLGTIAKSGTADVFEKIEEAQGSDAVSDLIGQFGVGFYSSFLVADRVMVTSKHNDDEQYIWESDGGEGYSVIKDPRGNTLPRGTTISLYLKEEAHDFLRTDTIKGLITKYSQFINFPIYLYQEETITEEVPVEEDEVDADSDDEEEVDAEKEDDDEDSEVEDDEEKEPAAPKTKTVTKKVNDYKIENSVKPIWTRPAGDVTDEEYNEFYKSVSKQSDEPAARTHFAAEGEIGFKAMLFIPSKAPRDLYTDYGGKKARSIKLYVRRVFITDDFSEMMPKYLNWLVGVVDSDDLPLNVSREQLQQDKLLKVIKKKLVRKALDMIKKMDEETYANFWDNFGTSVKLGVIEDSSNRNRLAKLLRFHSSNDNEEDTTSGLEDYVERMKEKQEKIYFVGGNGLQECKNSPFVERLIKKGYEVLYLTEPVDEYAIQALPEFDGKRFQNAAKEGLGIDDGKKAKEQMDAWKKEFEPLTAWLKDVGLKDKILEAEVTERLDSTPAALVASSYGWSGNMQRIMEAQAYKTRADSSQDFYSKQKKKFEINPRHPLIKNLNERIQADQDDAIAVRNAQLMFDTAVLRSDYIIVDKPDFAQRILDVMYANLEIDGSAEVEEEAEIDEDEDEEDSDGEAIDADDDDDFDEDEDIEDPEDLEPGEEFIIPEYKEAYEAAKEKDEVETKDEL
jgi:heat shock protein beta